MYRTLYLRNKNKYIKLLSNYLYQKGGINPITFFIKHFRWIYEKMVSEPNYSMIDDILNNELKEISFVIDIELFNKNATIKKIYNMFDICDEKYFSWIVLSFINGGIFYNELSQIPEMIKIYELLNNKKIIEKMYNKINKLGGIHGYIYKDIQYVGLKTILTKYESSIEEIKRKQNEEKKYTCNILGGYVSDGESLEIEFKEFRFNKKFFTNYEN